MTKFTTRLCAPVFLSSLMVFTAPLVSEADGNATLQAQGLEEGGRARINVAGQMNVLGQTAAAASCMINAGIEVEHERAVLAKAQADFNRMLWAMEHSDPALGIPTAESYSKVIIILREVHAQWDPMDQAITRILDNTATDADAQLVAQNNPELLKQTELLVSTITSEYANPFDLLLKDALSITFAERQEMFAEKLLREACDIHSGNGAPELMADFEQTINLFGQTLTALHDGYPAAGISPPPTDGIKAALELAQSEWATAKPLLTTINADGAASAEQVAELSVHAETLDHIMHKVVIEYLLASPGANDMIEGPVAAYADDVLMAWVSDPLIIEAVKAQNAQTAALTYDDKAAMNSQWTAEIAAGDGVLMGQIADHPVSAHLANVKAETSNVVLQAFITDAKGLKVASSTPTSHIWHGEQSHFVSMFGSEAAPIYVGDAKLQHGNAAYQSRVSLPIIDPETNERIGVATFGVNVQHMF